MKRVIIFLVLGWSCICIPPKASAQSQEMQQLILNIEKLAQFKSILEDMKKGYDILLNGYNAVKDISEGNFSLHKLFLDRLLDVSPTVRKYKRVGDIITYQIMLVREYKAAFNDFRASSLFDAREMEYMGRVYSQLFDESLDCLEDLIAVLTAGRLRMSDEERLAEIDYLYDSIRDKVAFLRSFNHSTSMLAVQRLKEKKDVDVLRKYHAIE